MKANDEIILKVFSNIFEQSNSIKQSITTLLNFDLINQTQYQKILNNLKSNPKLEMILLQLTKNQQLINFIIFFNNYYLLPESIEKSLLIIRKKNKIIKEIVSSLVYPAILILLTSLALLFISMYIVPQLTILNPNDNSEYQLLMALLKYVPLVLFISLLLIIVFVLVAYLNIKKRLIKTLELLLKIPVINRILKYYVSLTFAMYLKETIKDVPLSLTSIVSLEKQCKNRLIQYLCSLIKEELLQGEDIFKVLENISLLTKSFVQTIIIAQDSKRMAVLLDDYFETNIFILQKRIKLFLAIFIPIIVSIIGVILIMMYLIIMLPILDMDVSL